MAKKGLGKGLGSLISTVNTEINDGESIVNIKITDIEPNKEQPRENFDELSRKVKESVDSNVLELGLSFFLIIVICLDILKTLDIISIIPWLPIIEFYIGIMYCFQYIGFIIVMKKKLVED